MNNKNTSITCETCKSLIADYEWIDSETRDSANKHFQSCKKCYDLFQVTQLVEDYFTGTVQSFPAQPERESNGDYNCETINQRYGLGNKSAIIDFSDEIMEHVKKNRNKERFLPIAQLLILFIAVETVFILSIKSGLSSSIGYFVNLCGIFTTEASRLLYESQLILIQSLGYADLTNALEFDFSWPFIFGLLALFCIGNIVVYFINKEGEHFRTLR